VRKPERSVPDTNTIVRYLVGDDPTLAAEAVSFFDDVRKGDLKALILESVIAECVYVLTKIYRAPRARVAASLIDMLRYKGVVNEDREELIRALTLFSEKRLDIVDCVLLAKAAARGDRLFTFDADLRKLAERA